MKRLEEREALLAGLRGAPVILSAFVGSIPEEQLDRRRGEGFWTLAEHLSHLALVQPMLLERLHWFQREEHPEFIPFLPGQGEEEPATPPRLTMSAALDQFTRYREQQLALLQTADEATWGREGTHPEYERYSLAILVRHILMHDHWHMYRMEELWLTRDAFLTRLE
jgi:uncharacterized damage-inducible protein DinB